MLSQNLLENITLTGADLKELGARNCALVLRNCNLESIDLRNYEATDWRFERCNLSNAHFNGARFDNTTFLACRAATASFVGATLMETTIDGGDFSNSTFRGTTLSSVKFTHCKMTGVDMTDADAFDVCFDNVLLVLANMRGFSFRKHHLDGVNFSDADLSLCDFRGAIMTECSLRNTNISECRFEDADLRGVDIGGIKLTAAHRFKGATISKRQAAELLAQLGMRVV